MIQTSINWPTALYTYLNIIVKPGGLARFPRLRRSVGALPGPRGCKQAGWALCSCRADAAMRSRFLQIRVTGWEADGGLRPLPLLPTRLVRRAGPADPAPDSMPVTTALRPPPFRISSPARVP